MPSENGVVNSSRHKRRTVSPSLALPFLIRSSADIIVVAAQQKLCAVLHTHKKSAASCAASSLPVSPMKCSILFDPTGTGSAAGRAELRSWDGLAAQLLHRSHYGGLPGALGCSTVPHWCGHVQRTFCNFPGRICPLSAHGSRHAVKHTLTDKTCPLGAKIQVQHDAQTAFGSVGATCASAHMMRSGAKTF